MKLKKVAIWQYLSISGKHRHTLFLIFVFCPSQIKNYIITRLVSNFFNASCKRVKSSMQKRKHHKSTHGDVTNKSTSWMVYKYTGCEVTLKRACYNYNYETTTKMEEAKLANREDIQTVYRKYIAILKYILLEKNLKTFR